MLKIKEYKGITLIALVVSIIVLLILAGVTINAISGSESAPAKANEAGQKNDIGAAKDDISLTVTNAKMQGMETAYVENGVSASDTQNVVGRTVIQAVADKYATNNQIGKATITVDVEKTNNVITDDAIVSISTADFEVEGTITLNDGILTWGEIEPNVPRISGVPETLSLDTNSTYLINAKLKGTTGSISWSSDKPSIASVSNGVIKTALSITNPSEQVTITASADGCESKICILTVTKTMPYAKDVLVLTNNVSPYVYYTDKNGITRLCRVLYNDVDVENTHGLQIITDSSIPGGDVTLGIEDINYKDDENLTETQKAQNSYNNAIVNLNKNAEKYMNNKLSSDARCVGSISTISNGIFYNKDNEELLTNPDNYEYLETYVNQNFKGRDNNYIEDWEQLMRLLPNDKGIYWLASRITGANSSTAFFRVRYKYVLNKDPYMGEILTSKNMGNVTHEFKPVFLLKTNVKISGGEGTSTSPYELFAE